MANQIHGQYQAGKHLLGKLRELSAQHPNAKVYIDRITNNVTPLVAKTEALGDMAETPNPLLNTAANFDRVAKKLDVFTKDATRAVNLNAQEHNDGVKALNAIADTRLKLNVKSDNHNAFMLRFANMSKAEIWSEAVQAMKTGDSEFMATVIKAHPFLSGLSSQDIERIRADYVKVQAPDIADSIAALDEALTIALSIDRVTQIVKGTLSDPRRLAEIQRGVDAAERAEAAFNAPPVVE